MKVSEGRIGRVFTVRLEDGEMIPDVIEKLAAQKNIDRALVTLVGGINSGELVEGPEDNMEKVVPMINPVIGVHETVAVGTIFPDEEGTPKLHMHSSLGRDGVARTGCVRMGLEVWKVGELMIFEVVGSSLVRMVCPKLGFTLLNDPGEGA